VDAYSKWIIYHFITVHILFFPWYQKFENGRDVALKVTSESKKKNFIWMVDRNRIQTVDNLGKKNWKGSKFCLTLRRKKVWIT
jgi:hypothetical protein